jgi:hypothetical protein
MACSPFSGMVDGAHYALLKQVVSCNVGSRLTGQSASVPLSKECLLSMNPRYDADSLARSKNRTLHSAR